MKSPIRASMMIGVAGILAVVRGAADGRPDQGRAATPLVVMGHATQTSDQGVAAPEQPGQRLSSIVGVAVGEYGKGIDERGRLISAEEYAEATGFLRDGREVADRLPGTLAGTVRPVLDTLIRAADARRPPNELEAIYGRFLVALGTAGALELPREPISIGAGASLYGRDCASCHGATGGGDGPAARGLSTVPPAIGRGAAMRGMSPALAYRLVSVGVRGTAMPAWASELTATERWNVVAYVFSLHSNRSEVRVGEGLYIQRCASCHGASGGGTGIYAHDLSTSPPAIGTLAWQAERSDSQLAQSIREGLPGTVMPASRDLSPADVTSLVAFIRSLPAVRPAGPALASAVVAAPSDQSEAEAAAARVEAQMNAAMVAARGGRLQDAQDRAFDSYIAFEPLETPARAKNPGLVSTMERHFADFKGAIRKSDLGAADRSKDAIEMGLPEVLDLTKPTGGGWSAFLQSFLIILREGFEAILVVGAVVAFLIKTGHKDRLRSIWWGVALGVLASGVTAVVLTTVLRALPASREIIEGATLLLAVAVLFSVSYWLFSKVEAAHWQRFIQDKVTTALSQGGGTTLAFVAFLAVYREGAETALFYQALFSEGAHTALPLAMGIVAGMIALAIIFTLFYRFGLRIPLRPFFTVTSALLYYMAFVFAGKGVRELQEGGAVPITLLPGFPHIEAMGIFPSVETLLAQLLLLVLLAFALIKTFWPKRSVALPTIPIAAPVSVAVTQVTVEPAAPEPHSDQRLAALEAEVDLLRQRLESGGRGVARRERVERRK